ncbi:TetR/AcrR family transcriptional regulator [Salinicola corii]|uniref:TetR/AcrR family transcriptional regulator n=1 Tax=Salinicola corii TaxID=2606937 RepID=A0A640WI78_9GAMM|nr:TetR/AcrR family transcriptional regulator [Salinicola corii]KAA0020277.1 TetR/AcrR family transcriptional regulator [Salinicola corii]
MPLNTTPPERGRPKAPGRPREFDHSTALTAAMQVFWKYGYAGASIGMLIAEMGISRATLYASFGDKQQLFKQVLDLYEREKAAYMLDALEQPTSRRVAEHLMRGTIELQTNTATPKGSMGVVHSISYAPGDESIREYVAERGRFWRSKLLERFERADQEGDFPETCNPHGLAMLLKAATDGLLVAASSGASEHELNEIASTFLDMWPGR